MHGDARGCTGMHGDAWGDARGCTALHGDAWGCMGMHRVAWGCMGDAPRVRPTAVPPPSHRRATAVPPPPCVSDAHSVMQTRRIMPTEHELSDLPVHVSASRSSEEAQREPEVHCGRRVVRREQRRVWRVELPRPSRQDSKRCNPVHPSPEYCATSTAMLGDAQGRLGCMGMHGDACGRTSDHFVVLLCFVSITCRSRITSHHIHLTGVKMGGARLARSARQGPLAVPKHRHASLAGRAAGGLQFFGVRPKAEPQRTN